MRIPAVQAKRVLVTGCSSGIGAATARLLAASGWRVFATARKEEDLAALRAAGMEPVRLELADGDSVRAAAETVLAACGAEGLGAVVHNAGFCQAGAVEDLTREALRGQFEANFFGMHELTRALLPQFRRQGWGRIVVVSSVFGRMAVPMVGAYCASKFALEAWCDSLRVELAGSGVWVAKIEPGAILSRFRKNAAEALAANVAAEESRHGEIYRREVARRRRQVKKRDFFTRPPEEAAAAIWHALESARPKRRYPVTPSANLVDLAVRFVPRALIDRVLEKRVPQ
jgi:NAD(P)-dependent dehydrogenase (short-subunit alcohol dehydrogenase family)